MTIAVAVPAMINHWELFGCGTLAGSVNSFVVAPVECKYHGAQEARANRHSYEKRLSLPINYSLIFFIPTVIRNRLVAFRGRYRGPFDCIREVLRTDGALGLWNVSDIRIAGYACLLCI